eukprot:SAG22_NODE_4331_length_1301_cov_0.975042_1_plen_129_part_00
MTGKVKPPGHFRALNNRDDSDLVYDAYQTEYNSIDELEVISHDHFPSDLKELHGIDAPWIPLSNLYAIKNDGRYKVRSVLEGNNCVKGIHYEAVFAPTPRLDTNRLFLADACPRRSECGPGPEFYYDV